LSFEVSHLSLIARLCSNIRWILSPVKNGPSPTTDQSYLITNELNDK
jgi:hypothetical protein